MRAAGRAAAGDAAGVTGADERVVVIGAGPAGLATAGALRLRGIDALVLDRASRPGDSWHRRYVGLRLNTVRWMSDLPGHRMARRHGRWPARHAWAAYLEEYARAMRLRIALGTEVTGVGRDGDGGYRLRTTAGDLRARHVAVATGHDHAPQIPDWPGRASFEGELLHSSRYRDPRPYRGRDVLVVGGGNSATEIATFLAGGGASSVRISIRTPPLILKREYLGLPATPFGLPLRWLPDRLLDRWARDLQELTIGDLSAYGLPRSPKRLSDAKRMYYAAPMDSGFVGAVRRRAIEVVPAVERFDRNAVVLADGTRLTPAAVIAATGYTTGLEPLVGHLGVLDGDGEPLARSPREAPGLHFPGFRFDLLALLPHVSGDARAIARRIESADRRAHGGRRLPGAGGDAGEREHGQPGGIHQS